MSESAPPVSAPGSGTSAHPWLPVLLVAATGAVLAWISASAVPDVAGARRAAAPHVLLGGHAALTALLLARPGRRDLPESAALALVAAPFTVALAAAAGAGPGFLSALTLCAAAWASAAVVAARIAPRVATAGAAILAFALPLAAYGVADFARLPAHAAFLASPLTGPVLLAYRADAVSAVDAVPAIIAAALLLAAATVARGAASRATVAARDPGTETAADRGEAARAGP